MKILHINNDNGIKELNGDIKNGKNVYLLIYMEGCMPCNMVRPEWQKLESAFAKNKNTLHKDTVIADVERENMSKLKLQHMPMGFPSIRMISGNVEDDYKNDRSTGSFVSWIDETAKKHSSQKKSKNSTRKQKPKKKSANKIKNSTKKSNAKKNSTRKQQPKKGGKWSLKYKRSINCKHPKGFSQKQHCKYGRKKKH
jgi:FtsZ-interacting cell division protein YlmF